MNEGLWTKKDENQIKAQKQISFMKNNFSKETLYSVQNSITYTGPLSRIDWTEQEDNIKSPHVQLLDMDTTKAILHVKNVIGDNKYVKVAVLNFASYQFPGGKFIEGSGAQEESLCHTSNLYNIISDKNFIKYYIKNRNNLNRNLYTDRAIYSPDVIFHNEDKNIFTKIDVVTCAAPNWTAAQKWKVTPIENTLVFAQRIQFLKTILEFNRVDIAIFGAWGCGVFGQDPQLTAQLFNFIFSKSKLKNIIYAIPKKMNIKNYDAFNSLL